VSKYNFGKGKTAPKNTNIQVVLVSKVYELIKLLEL